MVSPITFRSFMVKIIQPVGILDSINGNNLRREVIDAVEAGTKTILIDCQAIELVDSSGLGVLVMSLKKVRDVGGRLVLCSINDQLRMLLELTDMDSVFEIFANQEAFSSTSAS
jgi:anti-anti-sigma factor